MAFFVSAGITSVKASLNCFSFIPYALDKNFVSLPLNKEFCFLYSGDYTYMKTNEFGARIIEKNDGAENIIAFGESQLLGLDYSDSEGPHDLHLIFPDNNLEIYAAPNNGPFEASNQIRHLEQKSLRGNGWLTGKNIVIGFNYSTDIFRINDGWDPRRFVPLEKKDLEKIFLIPGYHDLLLLKARIAGKKFGSTVSDASKTIDYYFKISDEQRQENIERWLVDLRNNAAIKGAVKTLVIFPPYWYSAASKIRKNQIRKHVVSFGCAAVKSGVFKDIWIGSLPSEKTKMAEDNRHYLSGGLSYNKFDCSH
tara:strand:+ start:583 stop:1509 length:927 start_codon:yes stop_codon:yes gene_type:complete